MFQKSLTRLDVRINFNISDMCWLILPPDIMTFDDWLIISSLQLKKQRLLYRLLCLKERQGWVLVFSLSAFLLMCHSDIVISDLKKLHCSFSFNTKKPDCRYSPPSTPTVHKSTTDWHFQIPFDVIFTSAKSNPLNSIFRISSPQPCLNPICCL